LENNKSINNTITIADIYGLSSILKTSHHTLKKNWRKLPHFFIGDGRNLKGARFDVSEVIEHLKKEARHVSMETSKKKCLDSEIHAQQQTVQEGRLRKQVESIGMGSSETRRTGKSAGTGDGTDPFNLLTGINNVS
jgi:hypothetical protein